MITLNGIALNRSLEMKNNEIEIGSKVKITDLSYSKQLDKNGLSTPSEDMTDGNYEVIAIGCICPVPSYIDINNTMIIRDLESGVCIFTQERFLKLTHCSCCGQKIAGPTINVEVETHGLDDLATALDMMQHDLFRTFGMHNLK